MAIQSTAAIKATFQTGDRPTQAQFGDLIDSIVHMSEVNVGTVTISGTISATTGSFAYLDISGVTAFPSITVGGGYGNSGLTIAANGELSTNGKILSDQSIEAGTFFRVGSVNVDDTDLFAID